MEYFGLRVSYLNHQEKLRKTRSTAMKLLSLNFQRSISRIHGHALSVNHSFPRIEQACVPVTYLKLKLNGLIFCWYIFARSYADRFSPLVWRATSIIITGLFLFMPTCQTLLYRYWWNTTIFPFTKKSYFHLAEWRHYFYLSRVRILVSSWLLT